MQGVLLKVRTEYEKYSSKGIAFILVLWPKGEEDVC